MNPAKAALYASHGPVFSQYQLDLENFALTKSGELELPTNVQYAWRHSDLPILYVACSTIVNRDNVGNDHAVFALAIDEQTGALSIMGDPIALPYRPVHMTCDAPTKHVLLAFNYDHAVLVIRLNDDGSLDSILPQREDLDPGVFPHQILVTPDNRFCLVSARGKAGLRGWWSYREPQLEPGSLEEFDYLDGSLGERRSVTVGDGLRFGPRNLDFHPTGPWLYVASELQNEAVVFARDEEGRIEPTPLQTLPTLPDPDNSFAFQIVGAVHVHPRGHAVYFVNRGSKPIPSASGATKALVGVDNTFVVYAIDQETGTLTEIQRIDAGGISTRTFTIDPTGRMLIASNSEAHWVTVDGETTFVPANMSTFKIHDDGRLEFKNRYDIELSPGRKLFWSGVVSY